MPIFSSQLGKIESQNTEQSIKVMANHLRKIQEELEYRLMHLDSTNVTEIDASNTSLLVNGKNINNVIEDNEGNHSALVQTVDKISTRVEKTESDIGNLQTSLTSYSTIEQTAEKISVAVTSITEATNATLESYSTIEQTASGIAAAVSSVQTYTDEKTGAVAALLENYSTITQTDSKISTAVSSVKEYADEKTGVITKALESYSTITQTDSKIAAAVSSSNTYTDEKTGAITESLESYSTITQTASQISSAVSESKSYTDEKTGAITGELAKYSTITQTSDAIAAAVVNLETGMGHMLKLGTDGVTIVDGAGNKVMIQSGNINAAGLTVDAANITGELKVGVIPDSIARTSQLITKSEVTTITHNAISTANISASRITTGSLNAGNLSMKGLLKVCDANGLIYGYIGATDVGTTSGAALTGPNQQHACMATNTGAKLTYSVNEHMIWVAEDGCSSSSAMKVFSDRRLKEDICYELDDAEKMFEKLQACSFHMTKDKNKKKSWGFIAQEAISAAEEAGMDADKLAMFGNYEGMHTIAYGEMTALNTHMIQKLMKRVAALEEART